MSDEWKPIETAPKDGTEVLLLWFDAETGAAPMHRVGFWHSREQAWCDTHRVLNNQHSHPTHWMPLPNAERHQGHNVERLLESEP